MKIVRKIWVAGKTIIVKESPKRERVPGEKRVPKLNTTSEKVWESNLRQSIFKLTLILNNNFVPGDYHLQLTYKHIPSLEQAKKDRTNFCRNLKKQCKKLGINLKWAAVTEHKGKRVHHHIVCSRVPVSIIHKCWPHGHAFHTDLWDDGNYESLAKYLLKEASRGFEEEAKIYKRRYSTSLNMVIPECREEELSRIDLDDDPKAFKGYYIDGEVERYEHEVTRLTCRKYIQVSLTEIPRIKKWYKGALVPEERINWSKWLRESYQEHQEQLELL